MHRTTGTIVWVGRQVGRLVNHFSLSTKRVVIMIRNALGWFIDRTGFVIRSVGWWVWSFRVGRSISSIGHYIDMIGRIWTLIGRWVDGTVSTDDVRGYFGRLIVRVGRRVEKGT